MVSKQKRNILLTAMVIVALVVVSAFAVTNRQSGTSVFGDFFIFQKQILHIIIAPLWCLLIRHDSYTCCSGND